VADWKQRLLKPAARANPQRVADGIAAILDNPRPRLRYLFGTDARMGVWLRGLLPWWALERLLIKAGGAGK
jgi:hypothetical protein